MWKTQPRGLPKLSLIKNKKKQSSSFLFLLNKCFQQKNILGTLTESLCTLRTEALTHSGVTWEKGGQAVTDTMHLRNVTCPCRCFFPGGF